MKIILVIACYLLCSVAFAAGSPVRPNSPLPPKEPTTLSVTIPYMARPALHRKYANEILELALKLSEGRFGKYRVVQQTNETVIERQLTEIVSGELSVATSMPKKEWIENARLIQFPVLKGLASYRLFFTTKNHIPQVSEVKTIDDLKAFKIGQGKGWSTGDILEHYQFNVEYAPHYANLLPMLTSNRFQLLMRGVYEVEQEYFANKLTVPDLAIAEGVAIYTYLPMYFFVNKNNTALAERLEYGLQLAHRSKALDKIFKLYFWSALKLLEAPERKVFYLKNPNIDATHYERDKPYLLDFVHP